jgi:DNA-directed RNA polymerase specialized sigma subunit
MPPDETWEDIDRRLSQGGAPAAEEPAAFEETWESIEARLAPVTRSQAMDERLFGVERLQVPQGAKMREPASVVEARRGSMSRMPQWAVEERKLQADSRRRAREQEEGGAGGFVQPVTDMLTVAANKVASIPARAATASGASSSEQLTEGFISGRYSAANLKQGLEREAGRPLPELDAALAEYQARGGMDSLRAKIGQFLSASPGYAERRQKRDADRAEMAERPIAALAGNLEGIGGVAGARTQAEYEKRTPVRTMAANIGTDIAITSFPALNAPRLAPLAARGAAWAGGGAVSAFAGGEGLTIGATRGLLAMAGYEGGSAVAERVAPAFLSAMLRRMPQGAASRLTQTLEAAGAGQGMSMTDVLGPDWQIQPPAVVRGDWLTVGLNSALPGLLKAAFPEMPQEHIRRYFEGKREGIPETDLAKMDITVKAANQAKAEVQPEVDAAAEVAPVQGVAGGAGIEPATSPLTAERSTTEPPASVKEAPAQVPDGPGLAPEQAPPAAEPTTPDRRAQPRSKSDERTLAEDAFYRAQREALGQGHDPVAAHEAGLAARTAHMEKAGFADSAPAAAPAAAPKKAPAAPARVFGQKTAPESPAPSEAPQKPAVAPAPAPRASPQRPLGAKGGSSAGRRLRDGLKEAGVPVRVKDLDAAMEAGNVDEVVAQAAKSAGVPDEKWKKALEVWKATSYKKNRQTPKARTDEERNALFEENRGLAIKAAEDYAKSKGIPTRDPKTGKPTQNMDDLVSAAELGLLKALGTYDAGSGNKVSTYAHEFIQGEMNRSRREAQTVHIPENVQRDVKKMRDFADDFTGREGRRPTLQEVYEGTGLKSDDALSAAYAGESTPQRFSEVEEGGGQVEALPDDAEVPNRVFGQKDLTDKDFRQGQRVQMAVEVKGKVAPVEGQVIEVNPESGKVKILLPSGKKSISVPIKDVKAMRVLEDNDLPDTVMGSPRRSSTRSDERLPGEPLVDALLEDVLPQGSPGSRARLSAPRADTPEFTTKYQGKAVGANALYDALVRFVNGAFPIRFGRIRGKDHAGQWDPRQLTIRINDANNPIHAMHEVGHSTQALLLPDLRANGDWVAASAELANMGRTLYGSTTPWGKAIKEGWAEFMAKYMANRRDLATDAPKTLDWFEKSFLPKNSKFKAGLDKIEGLAKHYQSQGVMTRTNANLVWQQRSVGGMAKFLQTFKENWIEEGDPLAQMEQAALAKIKRSGSPALPMEMRPFTEYQALRGTSAGVAHSWITHEQFHADGTRAGPGLAEIVAPVNEAGLESHFYAYLQAKRQVELWRRDIKTGTNIREAARIVRDVEKNSPIAVEAAAKWWKWHDNLLQYGHDMGAIDAGTLAAIRAKSKHYTPFFKDMAQFGDDFAGGGPSAGQASGMRRIKGSARLNRHFAQTVGENANALIETFHRKVVTNAVIDLAESMGGLGKFVERIPPEMVKTEFPLDPAIKKQIEMGGGTIDPFQMGQMLDFWRPARVPSSKDPLMVVRRDGKHQQWYQVRGDIFRALEGMRPYEMSGPFARLLLQGPTRLLRVGATTANVPFNWITNPLRDFQTFMMQTTEKNPAKAAALFIEGLGSSVREAFLGNSANAYLKFYLDRGGRSATWLGQDSPGSKALGKRIRDMKSVEAAWEWLKDALQAPEMAGRAAEVKAMAKQVGWQPGQPMTQHQMMMMLLAGKQVTTDFSAGGRLAKKWNQMVPFFNAAIQGPRAAIRFAKNNPVAAVVRGIAYANLAASYWAMNKDEDWYKRTTPEERATYWMFGVGDEVVRVPKNFETSQVWGTLVEAGLDARYRQDPKGLWDQMKVLMKSGPLQAAATFPIHQDVGALAEQTPLLPKLGTELIANRNFHFNRPIESPSMLGDSQRKGVPKDERATPHTSPAARFLGKTVGGLSPVQYDHVIRGVGGGLTAGAARGFGAQNPGREREVSDTPVVGRVFRPGGKAGVESKAINDLHELSKYHNQRAGSKDKPETVEERTLRRIYVKANELTSRVLREMNQKRKDQESIRAVRDAASDYAEAALAARHPWDSNLMKARMALTRLAVKYGLKVSDSNGGGMDFD